MIPQMKLMGGPQDGLVLKPCPAFRESFWFTAMPGNKTCCISQNKYQELYRYDFAQNDTWIHKGKT